MRITNSQRRDQGIREIQGNLGRLAELQRQVASGKRFTRASIAASISSAVMVGVAVGVAV